MPYAPTPVYSRGTPRTATRAFNATQTGRIDWVLVIRGRRTPYPLSFRRVLSGSSDDCEWGSRWTCRGPRPGEAEWRRGRVDVGGFPSKPRSRPELHPDPPQFPSHPPVAPCLTGDFEMGRVGTLQPDSCRDARRSCVIGVRHRDRIGRGGASGNLKRCDGHEFEESTHVGDTPGSSRGGSYGAEDSLFEGASESRTRVEEIDRDLEEQLRMEMGGWGQRADVRCAGRTGCWAGDGPR
jgi:hypothetical protein